MGNHHVDHYWAIHLKIGQPLWRLANINLNVRGPSYPTFTKSISCLLMSWFHQQPYCTLCKIGRPLSYTRKDFNYPGHAIVKAWYELQIHNYFSCENFSMQRVYPSKHSLIHFQNQHIQDWRKWLRCCRGHLNAFSYQKVFLFCQISLIVTTEGIS